MSVRSSGTMWESVGAGQDEEGADQHEGADQDIAVQREQRPEFFARKGAGHIERVSGAEVPARVLCIPYKGVAIWWWRT